MKKLSLIALLLLANSTYAQDADAPVVEAPPFWQDTTFLLLAGGAVFLIIVLIVKKVMDRRREEDDYEDTNTQSEF